MLKGGGFAGLLALLQWCTLSTGAGTLVISSGLGLSYPLLISFSFLYGRLRARVISMAWFAPHPT